MYIYIYLGIHPRPPPRQPESVQTIFLICVYIYVVLVSVLQESSIHNHPRCYYCDLLISSSLNLTCFLVYACCCKFNVLLCSFDKSKNAQYILKSHRNVTFQNREAVFVSNFVSGIWLLWRLNGFRNRKCGQYWSQLSAFLRMMMREWLRTFNSLYINCTIYSFISWWL